MAPKRKRISVTTNTPDSRKKSKPDHYDVVDTPPSESQEITDNEEQHEEGEAYYKAKRILKESKNKYQIAWESDPETGEKYPPTWEPKENANEALVRDWQTRKRSKKSPRSRKSISQYSQSESEQSTPVLPLKIKFRLPPRVVENTPEEEQTEAETGKAAVPQSFGIGQGPDNVQGSPPFEPSTSPTPQLVETTDLPAPQPQIEVLPPSDFIPDNYTRFSPHSEASLSPAEYTELSPSLTTIKRPTVRFDSNHVVPDSQSFPDSSEFLSSTEAEHHDRPSSPVAPEEDRSDHPADSPVGTPSSKSSPPPIGVTYKESTESSSSEQEQPSSVGGDDQTRSGSHKAEEHVKAGSEALNDQAGVDYSDKNNIEADGSRVNFDPPSRQVSAGAERSPSPLIGRRRELPPTAAVSIQSILSTEVVQSQDPTPNRLQETRSLDPQLDNRIAHRDFAIEEPRAESAPAAVPRLKTSFDWINSPHPSPSPSPIDKSRKDSTKSSAVSTPSEPNFWQEGQVIPGASFGFTEQDTLRESSIRPSIESETIVPKLGVNIPSGNVSSPSSSSFSNPPTTTEVTHPIPTEEVVQQIETGISTATTTAEHRVLPIEQDYHNHTGAAATSIQPTASEILSGSPITRLPPPSQLINAFDSNQPTLAKTSPFINQPMIMNQGESTSSTNHWQSMSLTDRWKAEMEKVQGKYDDTEVANTMQHETLPMDHEAHIDSALPPVMDTNMDLANQVPSQVVLGDVDHAPTHFPEQPELDTSTGSSSLPLSIVSSSQGNDDVLGSPTFLDSPWLGKDEHIVPLSMEGVQGDQYTREIYNRRLLIRKFLGEPGPPSTPDLAEIEEFLTALRNMVTHMDLLHQDSLTQYEHGIQATWDVSCSAKFRFVGQLLEVLRGRETHIALLGSPYGSLNLLENFLIAKRINYTRPDAPHKAGGLTPEGPLTVTLLPINGEEFHSMVRPATLILVVDTPIDTGSGLIQALRNGFHPHRQAPIISLVCVYSIEHIERCIPGSIVGLERLRILINCIVQLRPLVGKLPDELPNISAILDSILNSYYGVQNSELEPSFEWPLPSIGGLGGMLDFDELTQVPTQPSIPINAEQPVSGIQKRQLELEQDEPTKKMRMTPQPEAPEPASPPQVMDHQPSIVQDTTVRERAAANSPKINLGDEVAVLRKRERELEDSMHDLQSRFEDQLRELRKLRKEKSDADTARQSMKDDLKYNRDLVQKLKEENKTIKEQIAAANEVAEGSKIPEIAEFARLQRENQELQAALTKSQASYETTMKEFDYLRDTYQTASSSASQLSEENRELSAQVERLSAKASDANIDLRQRAVDESSKAQMKMLMSRIQTLELKLKDREDLLRRKDDELKGMRNNRAGVGTRATSVPKSPRVGAAGGSRPASPMPVAGVIGRLGLLRNGERI